MSTPESESSRPRNSASQVELRPTPSRYSRPLRWLSLTVLLLATSASVWLWAQGPQPAFGTLIASPPNFVFDTPTTVTFTVQIKKPTLNPTTVELQRVDADGLLQTSVGRMEDTGQGGDLRAGDRVFTIQVTLNESEIGRLYFRVDAVFRGNQNYVFSELTAVDVDPFPLPPDPGEAGKQTLEGIDSDNDGVRDDVQRWIAIVFLNNQVIQQALQQHAVALQDTLSAVDPAAAQEASSRELAAARCLAHVAGTIEAYRESINLSEQVLNTSSRQDAYRAYTTLFSPSFDSPDLDELGSFCTFDLD